MMMASALAPGLNVQSLAEIEMWALNEYNRPYPRDEDRQAYV